MLEIFCGVPYSESIKFKIGDINTIVSKINKALEDKPSLINKFITLSLILVTSLLMLLFIAFN